MPNLSIKDVPETLAEKLRQRAARNHRSLQGELMALLDAAANESMVMVTPPRSTVESAPLPTYLVTTDTPATADQDELLVELDAIVAGSHWGNAPLLTREQIHDRRLIRELEYLRKDEASTREA
ncbi:MAG: Arc family DNA-binding protein [Betaproteobacteria bacterium]|nr:Arc family DNA-binding protein [Betaproteobacteria bacterium]